MGGNYNCIPGRSQLVAVSEGVDRDMPRSDSYWRGFWEIVGDPSTARVGRSDVVGQSFSGLRLSLPVHVELDECNASVIADGQHSRKLSGTAVVSPEIASEGGSGKGDTGAARMC